MSEEKESKYDWIGNLILSLASIAIGVMLLLQKWSDSTADTDPTRGSSKSKFGKAVFVWLAGLEGTTMGYIAAILLIVLGGFGLFRIYLKKLSH